jgi:hypothetical protein
VGIGVGIGVGVDMCFREREKTPTGCFCRSHEYGERERGFGNDIVGSLATVAWGETGVGPIPKQTTEPASRASHGHPTDPSHMGQAGMKSL